MSSNSTEKPRQEQRPLPAREDTHSSPHQAQCRTDLAASEATPAKVLVTFVASLGLILLALVMCGLRWKIGGEGRYEIIVQGSGALSKLRKCSMGAWRQ